MCLRQLVKQVEEQEQFSGLSLGDEHALPTMNEFIETSFILPGRLFFTEPIVLLTSVMAASVCGLVYLFSEALVMVYSEGFAFSLEESSLVMLSVAAGVPFSFLPRIHDFRKVALRMRELKAVEPEDKLFGFYIATPVLACGMWWFALTVPPLVQLAPWVSIPALMFIGFAVVEFGKPPTHLTLKYSISLTFGRP